MTSTRAVAAPATPTTPPRPEVAWDGAFARRTQGAGGAITAILALADATGVIAFSGGFPAPETFPTGSLSDLAAELIRDDPARALQYAPTPGLPGFRQVIADRLGDTQGLRPGDDELLVTSGGIDALGLIGSTMLDGGDLVAVEAPTYLGAITAFRGFEAELCEIPVDGDGLDVEVLGRALASGARPKLLYTIPDHQNPTGLTLSVERRQALVELCRRYGVLVVEDVAYRELGSGGDELPSLWSLGPDIVVQIGTFSKTLFPGVRLGWAVGPAPVVSRMVTAKQNTDQCAGALGQRLAEEHLRRGGYDEQLPRSRALYGQRREAMMAACVAHLPPDVTWTEPTGGFFTWLTAPAEVDTTALQVAATAAGVAYVPGSPFYVTPGRGGSQLRLSYSRATLGDIDEGIRRLGLLLGSAPRRRPDR